MKNKTARALAVIALVFMGIFSGALIATLVDPSLMNGGIGYLALSSGVFSLMVFFALRADGKILSGRKTNMPRDDGADDEQGVSTADNASEQEVSKSENTTENEPESDADDADRADEEIIIKDDNNG